MQKKSVKKSIRSARKKPEARIETKIIDNLIELQKVHTSLASKFDNLAEQISGLLALFEMTARSFATQPHIQMAIKDKEFLDKIDRLLEQNKTLAKGLTIMEQKMREKIYGPSDTARMERRPPSRLQRF